MNYIMQHYHCTSLNEYFNSSWHMKNRNTPTHPLSFYANNSCCPIGCHLLFHIEICCLPLTGNLHLQIFVFIFSIYLVFLCLDCLSPLSLRESRWARRLSVGSHLKFLGCLSTTISSPYSLQM